MSHAAVVLKQDWSITCNTAVQYEAMKDLLVLLGYTFLIHDRFDECYNTVCSSDMIEGGVTQSYGEEEHHFETFIDFLVFHYEAEDLAAAVLAFKEQQAA